MSASTWVTTRLLIQERESEFLHWVRKKLGDEKLTVYLDDDAIILVYGEDVLVSTEDEPLLFVGENHLMDLSQELKR